MRDPDFYRMSGWPSDMEVDCEMTWRDALKAGSFCIATIADLQAESFACLPAREEKAMRDSRITIPLVEAPEPVKVEPPSPHPDRTWFWLLLFVLGAAAIVYVARRFGAVTL